MPTEWVVAKKPRLVVGRHFIGAKIRRGGLVPQDAKTVIPFDPDFDIEVYGNGQVRISTVDEPDPQEHDLSKNYQQNGMILNCSPSHAYIHHVRPEDILTPRRRLP